MFASVWGPFEVPIAMTAWIQAFSHVAKALNNKAMDLNRFYLTDFIAGYKQKTMKINARGEERLYKGCRVNTGLLVWQKKKDNLGWWKDMNKQKNEEAKNKCPENCE